jgi:hypothetical protein
MLTAAAADLGVSRATLYRLMHANRVTQDGAPARAADAGTPHDDDDSERDLPSLTASSH